MNDELLLRAWASMVLVNFAVQVTYYFADHNRPLYVGKRITTPALLFAGLAIVILRGGPLSALRALILTLMAVGEIGIEGSSVVESSGGGGRARGVDRVFVTVGGGTLPCRQCGARWRYSLSRSAQC